MKALGRKTLRQKVEIETDKYMQENYKELAYQVMCYHSPVVMMQTEALFLEALRIEFGFGASRLIRAHERFCSLANMPANAMGKIPTMMDAVQDMEKIGIDFHKVKPRFQTHEEFIKDEKT